MARGMTIPWETAARYQLLHAVALVGLAAWLRSSGSPAATLLCWAARCWVGGTLLFAGSLYWIALGGPRWLGPITPLGGLALMAGWILLIVAALKKDA